MLYFDNDARQYVLHTHNKNSFMITPKESVTGRFCFTAFEYVSGDMLYIYLSKAELENIRDLFNLVLATEEKP